MHVRVHAFDLDGKELWQVDVDGDFGERLSWSSREGTHLSTPLLSEGHLYWEDGGGVTRDGTYILPAKPRSRGPGHNQFESDDTMFDGTPAVCRGQLAL